MHVVTSQQVAVWNLTAKGPHFFNSFRTNSDYFTVQNWLVGFCNWDGVCLLRGTDWVLYNSLHEIHTSKCVLGSGGWSSVSYRGSTGLIHCQSTWDFWCTNRHWDTFSSSTSVFPFCIIPSFIHNDHSFIFILTWRASGQRPEISKRNPLSWSAVQKCTFISDFKVLFSVCNTGWAATLSFTL